MPSTWTGRRPQSSALPRVGLLLLGAALTSCGDGRITAEFSGPTMGTEYLIKGVVRADRDLDALKTAIDGELERLTAIFSTYDDNSELSRVNAATSTLWVALSPELFEVMTAAIEVNRASGGAFDVTVGPLVDLWGFGPKTRNPVPPADETIDAARALVGSGQLRLREQPPGLKKAHPEVAIDLSALAKGYAVDRIAALLARRGVRRYLVEIGGEVRAAGVRLDGNSWQIGIERPVAGERDVGWIVALTDAALASSGDYRNFFELDGRRYSHTIDPRSGRPIEFRDVTVTVVHPDTMLADAWATGMMVLGPEAGIELAEQLGLAVQFVHSDGIARSTRFAELEVEEQP